MMEMQKLGSNKDVTWSRKAERAGQSERKQVLVVLLLTCDASQCYLVANSRLFVVERL